MIRSLCMIFGLVAGQTGPICATGVGWGIVIPTRTEQATPAGQVAVKQTRPLRVVYTEHIGPYWTVGPVFRSLSEYMIQHGQSGLIFARYPENPKSTRAASLRTRIGFVIDGEHQPQSPYKSMLLESELVAYQFVDTSNPNISKHYSAMSQWIRSNGYEPLGAIVEIHHRSFDRSMPNKPSVEIQMPVRKIRWDNTFPNFMETQDNRGYQDSPVIQKSPAPTIPEHHRMVTPKPKRPQQDQPIKKPEPVVTERPARSTPKVVTRSDIEIKPQQKQELPNAEPAEFNTGEMTLTELIESGYYDRVARRIMPQPDVIQPGQEIWFGQLIFRMKAVARGIEQIYPGEGRTVTQLVRALSARYEIISAHFKRNPLDYAFVRIGGYNDPTAKTRRELMRNLDTMLGKLAVKRLAADETTKELIDIIDRLYDLLRKD